MDRTEERMARLEGEVRALRRRLRGWRVVTFGGVALGLGLLGPGMGAALADGGFSFSGLSQRVAALEALLAPFSTQPHPGGGYDVFLTAANLHLRNGLGATNGHPGQPFDVDPATTATNGLGNLIVGYDEPRPDGPEERSGSHNVVVGSMQGFTRFGGLVAGFRSSARGAYATVTGGRDNTAEGDHSAVGGGAFNYALGTEGWVGGGSFNTAGGAQSAVSGGNDNFATGDLGAVCGGANNVAAGRASAVAGGGNNTAGGSFSTVNGGLARSAPGYGNAVSGAMAQDH